MWDNMTKHEMFNTTAEIRTGDKMVENNKERDLSQRFIVISRSRPELDFEECIRTYEFCVVPRSLIAPGGSLLLAYDNASVFYHLEKHNMCKLTETGQLEVLHLVTKQ